MASVLWAQPFTSPPPAQENSTFWEIGNIENSYEFERIQVEWWLLFMRKNWAWAFYASAIYITIIFGVEKWMRTRPEFDLRGPLIVWNTALGLFSIFAFSRCAPLLIQDATVRKSFYATICHRDKAEMLTAYWVVMFAISKFVELGDTLFIVLRKRKLQLLQYYHHIATLCVVWITTPDAEPVGLYYIAMNYGVHAVMYPYFALKMAGLKIPRLVSNIITTAQFLQMIVGFLLNFITVGLIVMGKPCFRTQISIWAFVAVYGSFIVLFGNLFRRSVLRKSSGGKQLKSD